MLNQEAIQKSYYQLLMPGHYIDVKNTQSEWKLAKIKDKDNRCLLISYDGIDSKQQHVFIHSTRVAPLRFHTEGYTGSLYRTFRSNTLKMSELQNVSILLKQHLQMLNKKFLQLPQGPDGLAFEITQYIRGQLFVISHSLLTHQVCLQKEQIVDVNNFLQQFIIFVKKALQKTLINIKDYFQSPINNKYLYLAIPRISLIYSLQQLLIILSYILKVDVSKNISLFKNNKDISQPQLTKLALETQGIKKLLMQIIYINDNNGRWLPIGVRKQAIKILIKVSENPKFPKYTTKDFAQAFQIYPFILQLQASKQTQLEYLQFMIGALRQQSPFEAKLKSLQEIRKILDKDTKFRYFQPTNVLQLLTERGVLEYMLDEFNFNPQIFKRFIPILNFYCKTKSLTQKQISSLFKLASNRHQSQMNTIYQIITELTDIVPVQSLDSIFGDIMTLQLNNDQTIIFIKNFTIKAVKSYSKNKTFFGSLFGRKPISSKYGHYGLNLFWREILDNGKIQSKYIPITLQMVKLIFLDEIFNSQRQTYIGNCINQLQKKKSFGQSIKFLLSIINSYPISAIMSQVRKDVIQKIDTKNNLIQLMIKGIKSNKSMNFQKVSYKDTLKYFYQFLQQYSQHLQMPLKVEHIEYLWFQGQVNLLMEFIKKNKSGQYFQLWKRKYSKRINSEAIKQIFTKITSKKSFYDRQISQIEYQTLDQLFLTYHFNNKIIDINERGTIRYLNTNFIGKQFYLHTIIKSNNQKIQQNATKRLIDLYLRPKSQDSDIKSQNWKKFLLMALQTLYTYPKKCVKFIQLFLTMIQGKQFRQNVNQQGNLQIIAEHNGVQKTITLARNSSIFRLRKMIMQAFDIKFDFTMYNTQMKKDVTFVEEEDFSVNAMSYKTKGTSIQLKYLKNQQHPHLQSIKKFREEISNQQKLYSKLFEFINIEESIHKEIWGIIQMLPVNKNYIRKLRKCSDFKLESWKQFINSKQNEQLIYSLNIIIDLMKNNQWTLQFYHTKGFHVFSQLFIKQIDNFKNQQLTIKLTKILLRGIQVIQDRLLDKQLIIQHIYLIIKVLKKWLKQQQQISLQLVNNIVNLFLKQSKITNMNLQKQLLQDNFIFRLIQFGLFSAKDHNTSTFSQEVLINLVLTHLIALPNKIHIVQKLILEYLSIEYLQQKKSIENYFIFLIDMLHSFNKQQQVLLFSNEKISTTIDEFIQKVMQGDYQDVSKTSLNEFNFGALKLISFQINSNFKFNDQIFNKIVNQFIFKEDKKRIKSQKTKKIVYDIVKKVVYNYPQKIQSLTSVLTPRLQKAQWRKNTYMSWALQSQKNQRKTFCGLENLTATCYINSLFQQLYMLEDFRDRFLGIDSRDYKISQAQNEIYQLQSIFATLKYSNKKSCSTKNFCQSFITYEGRPIDPAIQSDADEFFNALMEKIQIFLRDKKYLNVLQSTFQGKLSNQLNCQGCPHKSQKQQNFLSIGVNIKNKKTLNEALEGYVDGQILDGDNAYFCQPCSKKVRTMKRLCIKELPNVLVIVLKRFQFNYDQMRRIKINHELKYPQQLNMKQYTSRYLAGQQDILDDDNYMYNLRGVVVHSGTTEGGHYYSFIKHQQKWYEFNDETISQSSIKRVQQQGFGGNEKDQDGQFKMEKYRNAYILFYEKKVKKMDVVVEEVVTPFYKQMEELVLANNANAQFLSLCVDTSFVRFCESLAMIESIEAGKFALLFFHSVVLRDKNRDEYGANIYRLLSQKLKNSSILSQWFINQINHKIIKEFYIEAPKIVRYLSLGLLIRALETVNEVPQQFLLSILFCLNKKGMTPLANIFTVLSKQSKYKQKFISYDFDKRVINYLLDKKYELKPIMVETFQSYLGSDCSQKQKDLQFCSASLIQSLNNYDIQQQDALRLLQQYSTRNGNKVSAKLLTNKGRSVQNVTLYISSFQAKIVSGGYRRDDIQKYMFLIREYNEIVDQNWQSRMNICFKNLGEFLGFIQNLFDPFDVILAEINKLAARSKSFYNGWRIYLEQNHPTRKVIIGWIKECDKANYMTKNDDWKRKTNSMSYTEKAKQQQSYKSTMEANTKWMFHKGDGDLPPLVNVNSCLELAEEGSTVVVGYKKVIIKEHMGLLTKVQYEKQNRWCILERNELDLYQWL